ncbi:MAG TPA: hypothetical protein VF707_05555 [Ardenticatenaceae bacterium]|jgi:hypothetical protein
MPSHFILWPALVYVGAALLIPRLRLWLGHPGRLLALLLSSVAAFVLALLVARQAGGSQLVISTWSDLGGLGRGIRFGLDPLGGSFLLLAGLVGVGAFVGSLDEREDAPSDDYQAGLLVLLGALTLLGLAGNMLTLLLVGLVLDAGLIFGIGLAGRPRWLLVTIVQSLVAQALLLAAALLLWRDTGNTDLAGASQQVALLVTGAAVARMAPLPFSLFPVAFEHLPQRVLALLPLSTVGVGGLLLGRLAQAADLSDVSLDGLAALAVLGIALAGWVAWRREELSVRLMMLGAIQAGWVLWAFAWGLPTLALTVAWSGVLALAALAVHGGRLDMTSNAQLPGLLASLMLLGFPGSALWNAATVLSGEAWRRGDEWMLALATIGVMGTVAALFQWLLPMRAEPPQRSRWVGVTLLALLSVPAVGALFGLRLPALPAESLEPAPLAARLAVLVVGWSGGFWLWRVHGLLQSLRPFLDAVGAIFSFVWLWRLVGRVGWLALSGLRGMMLVLEGENYGWLLLFIFLTMIFVLQS